MLDRIFRPATDLRPLILPRPVVSLQCDALDGEIGVLREKYSRLLDAAWDAQERELARAQEAQKMARTRLGGTVRALNAWAISRAICSWVRGLWRENAHRAAHEGAEVDLLTQDVAHSDMMSEHLAQLVLRGQGDVVNRARDDVTRLLGVHRMMIALDHVLRILAHPIEEDPAPPPPGPLVGLEVSLMELQGALTPDAADTGMVPIVEEMLGGAAELLEQQRGVLELAQLGRLA